MKVNQTYINIPKMPTLEISVGDEFVRKEKDRGTFKVTQIDINENATYISVVDENEKDTTYGSKAFFNMYKPKG